MYGTHFDPWGKCENAGAWQNGTLTRLFLCPPLLGCRLRPVDVEFMKALHEKVNIVPLISKADCLIPSEIKKLKERVSKAAFRVDQF